MTSPKKKDLSYNLVCELGCELFIIMGFGLSVGSVVGKFSPGGSALNEMNKMNVCPKGWIKKTGSV
jgi:hypothetical protein